MFPLFTFWGRTLKFFIVPKKIHKKVLTSNATMWHKNANLVILPGYPIFSLANAGSYFASVVLQQIRTRLEDKPLVITLPITGLFEFTGFGRRMFNNP
jgi:hypothetical protein